MGVIRRVTVRKEPQVLGPTPQEEPPREDDAQQGDGGQDEVRGAPSGARDDGREEQREQRLSAAQAYPEEGDGASTVPYEPVSDGDGRAQVDAGEGGGASRAEEEPELPYLLHEREADEDAGHDHAGD